MKLSFNKKTKDYPKQGALVFLVTAGEKGDFSYNGPSEGTSIASE